MRYSCGKKVGIGGRIIVEVKMSNKKRGIWEKEVARLTGCKESVGFQKVSDEWYSYLFEKFS